MFNINTDDISESYDEFRQRIKDNKSFAVTGLTSVLRLFLLSKIKNYSKKKVLFITSSEQNALRYQSDLSSICDLKSSVMPFQNISMYETVSPNLYDYSEQIKTNDELVDDLTNALIFIDYSKKLPYSLKYGKQGKELEASLKNGLETGDFSKVSLNNYLRFDKINQMREKYISKLNVYQKRDFRSAASARSYKTREELSRSLNEERTK